MSWPVVILLGIALGLIAAALRSRRRPAARQPLSRRPVPVRPAPVKRIRIDVPTVLYHYDYAPAYGVGQIYWGISNDPPARHRQHENDPADEWWMAMSTGVMILDRQYPNRPLALAAERIAIQTGHAAGHRLANYQHNPGRRRRVAARQARRYT